MPWYTTEDARRDALRQRREPVMRAACQNCPFRADSPLGYDDDAMEALDRGYAPSCHDEVGMNEIFRNAPLTPGDHTACIGYRNWLRRAKGFRKPKRLEAADE